MLRTVPLYVWALAAVFAIPGQLNGQERPVALVGARIIPIAGPEILDGVVLFQDGRITAVGSAASVTIPANALRRDLAGSVVMPGLVDTHSHIGGVSGGDGSSPIQGETRAMDAINVRAVSIKKARAGGITTANVMPGSGHLMSGQTAYLKLRDGRGIEDLLLCTDDERPICGGMKMANGTNSRRAAPFPGTRAKSASLVREVFIKAQEYAAKVAAADGDPEKLPPRDLELEAIGEVLDGKRVIHHHTHRHDDILTVLRLKEEFGFRLVLQHISEGWKVAEEIAASGASSSVIVIDSPGGKLEAVDLSFETGKAVDEAGGLVGFHTDDGITDSRFFLRSAAFGVRAGMNRAKALEAVTIANAKMMDLDSRVGTLEVGKDADIIVLSGDPLATRSLVMETWVEGQLLFDRNRPEDRLIAEGGWGAGDDSAMHVHAEMEGHN